jgi:hypothetical protein
MATKKSCPKSDVACGLSAVEESTRRSEAKGQTSLDDARGDGHAALALPALSAASLLAAGGAELVAPNVLSLLHWERIEHGALYATSSRIDWRSLLRRTFQVDLRHCQRCGGPLSVRAVVTEPDDIERVLASIQRSRDPPTAA